MIRGLRAADAAEPEAPAAPDLAPAGAPRNRAPLIAAGLSFLWPGLGQLYAGKRRAAALFAAPALLALLLLAYELRQGLVVFAARFADPSFSLAAVAVVLLLGGWRLAAVLHASANGERHKKSGSTPTSSPPCHATRSRGS